MTSVKTARQKGKDLENYVADKIIEYGIDPRARRDGASGAGTREKGDICTSASINGINLGIECKNHAVAHVKDWWTQAQQLEKLGREPVVVYKLKGEGMGDTKVIIYLETFLELLQGQSGGVCDREHLPEGLKWKVKRLKDASHDLMKEL